MKKIDELMMTAYKTITEHVAQKIVYHASLPLTIGRNGRFSRTFREKYSNDATTLKSVTL